MSTAAEPRVNLYVRACGPTMARMIMKASLVNYYAGNYYRAYASPGRVQTDGRGSVALRERNLRIMPARILLREQWAGVTSLSYNHVRNPRGSSGILSPSPRRSHHPLRRPFRHPLADFPPTRNRTRCRLPIHRCVPVSPAPRRGATPLSRRSNTI